MNSVIQCLSNNSDLGLYFYSDRYADHINTKSKFGSRGELAIEFSALIKQLWRSQYKNITPKDMKNAISTHMRDFEGCEQHDAHEFLTMFLDKLSNDLNRANLANGPSPNLDNEPSQQIAMKKFWEFHIGRTYSIISEMFEGLTMSTLTCNVCGKNSHTFEIFTSLSLPIPGGNRVSLADCLKLF